MSKRSIVVKSDPKLPAAQPAQCEILEPARAAVPFFSFSYSVTEVASFAGRTRVKSSTTRLVDGKLVSEKLEGELENGAYERMARQAADQFADQLRLMMQPFSWFLPPLRETRE